MSQEIVNEAITLISQAREYMILIQQLHDTALVDSALHRIDQALDKLTNQNDPRGT